MSKTSPSSQPTPKSADREAKRKAKKADAGLVRLELWTKPEHRDAIKAYAAEINQQPNSVMQKI